MDRRGPRPARAVLAPFFEGRAGRCDAKKAGQIDGPRVPSPADKRLGRSSLGETDVAQQIRPALPATQVHAVGQREEQRHAVLQLLRTQDQCFKGSLLRSELHRGRRRAAFRRRTQRSRTRAHRRARAPRRGSRTTVRRRSAPAPRRSASAPGTSAPAACCGSGNQAPTRRTRQVEIAWQ